MKVLRFMSAEEAIKLLAGIALVNRTEHKRLGQASTSVGFCFFILPDEAGDAKPVYKAAGMLSGITLLQVCLVAELAPGVRFRRSTGHYKTGKEKELCTASYKLGDFASWRIYAPTGQSTLMPLFSGNYEDPVLVLDNLSFRGFDAVHTS